MDQASLQLELISWLVISETVAHEQMMFLFSRVLPRMRINVGLEKYLILGLHKPAVDQTSQRLEWISLLGD